MAGRAARFVLDGLRRSCHRGSGEQEHLHELENGDSGRGLCRATCRRRLQQRTLDGVPMAAERPSPRLGEHTEEILREIGEA